MNFCNPLFKNKIDDSRILDRLLTALNLVMTF